MNRLIFEQEHDIFRDSVARFMATEIAPHTEAWRRAGIVERSAYVKAGAAGLLCLWADPEFGGAGIDDLRFDQIVIEENVRQGDVAFYLHLHSNLVAPYLDKLGTPDLRSRLMPKIVSGEAILAIAMTETASGSDLRAVRTKAVRDGAGWRINGAKTYISNGLLSDAMVVVAQTGGSEKQTIGLFVAERGMQGFERGKQLEKMGLHAQDTAEIFFNDVWVPDENVLGNPCKGFSSLMQFLATERLVAAIASMAAAQTAFDLTLDFVRSRVAFGKAI